MKTTRRIKPGIFQTTDAFEKKYGALHRFEIAVEDEAGLNSWARDFQIDAPLEKVFDAYLTVHPEKIWPKEIITYQFAFEPGSSKKILKEHIWPVPAVGTKVFVDLRIKPISFLQVMTAVEFTKCDENQELRYDYMEGCTNHGYNSMLFSAQRGEDGSEVTNIQHRTRWKAPDRVMGLLMPLFYELNHGGFVSGYHGNMKRYLELGMNPEK